MTKVPETVTFNNHSTKVWNWRVAKSLIVITLPSSCCCHKICTWITIDTDSSYSDTSSMNEQPLQGAKCLWMRPKLLLDFSFWTVTTWPLDSIVITWLSTFACEQHFWRVSPFVYTLSFILATVIFSISECTNLPWCLECDPSSNSALLTK